MILFLVLNFIAASIVQSLGIDIFLPIDRDELYHIVMMAAAVFFYFCDLHLLIMA